MPSWRDNFPWLHSSSGLIIFLEGSFWLANMQLWCNTKTSMVIAYLQIKLPTQRKVQQRKKAEHYEVYTYIHVHFRVACEKVSNIIRVNLLFNIKNGSHWNLFSNRKFEFVMTRSQLYTWNKILVIFNASSQQELRPNRSVLMHDHRYFDQLLFDHIAKICAYAYI